jgi:hypothetical protein
MTVTWIKRVAAARSATRAVTPAHESWPADAAGPIPGFRESAAGRTART